MSAPTAQSFMLQPALATPLNRKRVTALAKALNTVVRAHRFTAPRGNGGAVIGEELNALALVVADVIRQAPDSAVECRAWFASTLIQIMEAPPAPQGNA